MQRASLLMPILAVFSCGDSATPKPDGAVAPPLAAPAISATVPADGAKGVAIDTQLELTFSRAIDVGSLAVVLEPPLELGDPVWNDANTSVKLTPAAPLASGLEHKVIVAAISPDGQALTGKTSFSFKTLSQPPLVLYSNPSAGATNVPPGIMITLGFSKPMDKTSVQSAFLSTPQIPCVWGWSADGTEATCAPSKLLDTNTHYNVTLVTGALDTEGQGLAAALALGFDTGLGGDKQPPTVLLVDPANGAKGVARSTKIKVTFSEPMDKASVKAAFKVVSPAGTGTVTWNTAGDEVTLDPQTDFAYGATVSWSVLASAKDLSGNALGSDLNRSFTTIRQKTVTIIANATLTGTVDACGKAAAGSLTVGECLEAYENCAPGGPCIGWTYNTHPSVGILDFDLTPLVSGGSTAINSAVVYAYETVAASNSYGLLGGKVVADHINGGTSLDAADLSSTALSVCNPLIPLCQSTTTLSTEASVGFKTASVTAFVRDDFANRQTRGNRSQLRLRFPGATGVAGDNIIEGTVFNGAGSGVNEPYLKVTYEYP